MEDIAGVWRAASTWHHVDPRAAEVRDIVVEKLRDRGVHIDATAGASWSRKDIARMSDALDRAAAARASGPAPPTGPGRLARATAPGSRG